MIEGDFGHGDDRIAMRGDAGMPRTYPPRAAVVSWIFFDWAAQPYFTLITTFVFAPYFATHVRRIPPAGRRCGDLPPPPPGLLIALLSPVLGAIADACGRRKPWIAGVRRAAGDRRLR